MKDSEKTNYGTSINNYHLFYYERFFCPICVNYYRESTYLKQSIIGNKRLLWVANMVTHTRHYHIHYWDKLWGPEQPGIFMLEKWKTNYETEKIKVNERAKRFIIRKCCAFLQSKGISSKEFELLENKDFHTLMLAQKKLNP
jgi:hypothetical protein